MTIRVHLISEEVTFDDYTFLVSDDAVVLGRSVRSDVQIWHPLISRLHCEMRTVDDELVLRDLNSTNQTILNGDPIQEAVLHTGDLLLLGDATYVVEFAAEPANLSHGEPPKKVRTSSEMPTARLKSSVISHDEAKSASRS